MPQILPFGDIVHLFREFEHTAWRLEVRRSYAADLTSEKFHQFLRTGSVPAEPGNAWLLNTQEQLALGKRFERVRVVDDPMTDNQRFLLASAVERPEDIRILSRAKAEALQLPEADFWLLDSKILATLHFDGEDRTMGVELSEEPDQVLRACQIRDAAWHYAIPAREFAATVPSPV